MFIGHYGVAFAVKQRAPALRLGLLFVAVQGLDILFATFLLSGVEHMNVSEGTKSRNLYDVFHLYDMGLSHSLAGAVAWGALTVLLVRLRLPWHLALWLGLAVFSHFVLDIPVHPNDVAHPPDLTLAGAGTLGIGFGLWNTPVAAVALELLTFGAGFALYARSQGPLRPRLWLFAIVLASFALMPLFIPPSGTAVTFAVQVLVMCALLAFWATWAERSRTFTASQPPTDS